MTKISDIVDVSEVAQLVAEGYVRIQHHPDDSTYSIYNYTHRAVGIEWTPTLREMRGLITHYDEVLARPFAKFFNSTEPQSSWLAQTDGDTFTIAMDKSDGSLGIAYLAPDGLPAIATRGSFSSDQAIHATELLRRRYPDYMLEENVTDLFEIVYPANRIVLDYGDMDDLVYLGYRYIDSGRTIPYSGTAFDASDWEGSVAEAIFEGNLSTALTHGDRENREGMVLYVFNEETGQFRLTKVKQADYVALHRIVTGLNERVVWEELKEGRFEALVENLPAEHAAWAKDVAYRLSEQVYGGVYDTTLATLEKKAEVGDDRKAFAMWAKDQPHSAALFAAYENNEDKVGDYFWKQVRPEANKPKTLVNEEA